MSRPKNNLAYTEINARPRTISSKPSVGLSSRNNKVVQNKLGAMDADAAQDNGDVNLENATGTQF